MELRVAVVPLVTLRVPPLMSRMPPVDRVATLPALVVTIGAPIKSTPLVGVPTDNVPPPIAPLPVVEIVMLPEVAVELVILP
jgi:hypothetical protein